MGNKKRSGSKRIAIVIMAIIFGLTLFIGVIPAFYSSKAEAETAKETSDENEVIQPNEEIQDEQSDNAGSGTKYLTFSRYNNIDITVNYLTPVNRDKDILTFEIMFDTHSVDLSRYTDLREYVELRTDSGIVISDGFEWNLESNEGHHMRGIMKIKNDNGGKPIIGSDTKSFRLLFKNVGAAGVREHVYEGDKLR